MAAKLTIENFIDSVKELTGDEYTVLPDQVYENGHTKLKIRHNTCGTEYEVTPTKFKMGRRCPKCYGTPKKTQQEFEQEVFNLVGDEYTVLGKYINNQTKILFQHNKTFDGNPHTFEMNPVGFIGKKAHRCPICCKYNNGGKTHAEFLTEVQKLVGTEYTILDTYKGCQEKIKVRHNVCNTEYEVTPNNFLEGYRCPNCIHKVSKPETEIKDFISSFYKGKIECSKRKYLNNLLEIDIYAPELKIGFEYDGLYYHSDLFKKDTYHFDKTNLALQNGIRLIHIFEDEWKFKQDIVKSKIRHILGCNDNPKVYARKCYITEIDTQDKNQFLNENHIQGEDRASIKLGLWYPINENEDRLVAVMTFCKPRYDKKFDLELSRFATDIEYCVIGAFGKLFKYFKDNYKWKSLVTYADRRWSVGGVYEKNGFTLNTDSKRKPKPSYSYTKGYRRENRVNYQKYKLEKLFPELYSVDKDERKIMKEAGYYRIYDCGNLTYVYFNE